MELTNVDLARNMLEDLEAISVYISHNYLYVFHLLDKSGNNTKKTYNDWLNKLKSLLSRPQVKLENSDDIMKIYDVQKSSYNSKLMAENAKLLAVNQHYKQALADLSTYVNTKLFIKIDMSSSYGDITKGPLPGGVKYLKYSTRPEPDHSSHHSIINKMLYDAINSPIDIIKEELQAVDPLTSDDIYLTEIARLDAAIAAKDKSMADLAATHKQAIADISSAHATAVLQMKAEFVVANRVASSYSDGYASRILELGRKINERRAALDANKETSEAALAVAMAEASSAVADKVRAEADLKLARAEEHRALGAEAATSALLSAESLRLDDSRQQLIGLEKVIVALKLELEASGRRVIDVEAKLKEALFDRAMK